MKDDGHASAAANLPRRMEPVRIRRQDRRRSLFARSVADSPFLSAPSEARSDVHENSFDHMRVVGDAQLVGYGQQQGVGLRDGLVVS